MVDGSVVTLLLAAAFVGALGALIKYAGMVQLIAGYDPDRVSDEAGLADFIGTNALYVAALALLLALVEHAEPAVGANAARVGFLVGVFALAARMLFGARRYEEPA
ncbi:DUF3784 domain-containing protein [Natronolimnohabitans innermongolicus]|uniref:DUF3784 domain-containing protein n=1 Tax=Natronolimnohabitans innermongolicus JCM 12255 TaxID=1227499 RepID=L9WIG1_9EURY|nr:DUF3784 domain-containing protein [Natronolimnohabitans innermongolicus]ELY49295.1 hypothetical protein C493_20531 [Natronolimnohabitans innermongolicus JCM 12255]